MPEETHAAQPPRQPESADGPQGCPSSELSAEELAEAKRYGRQELVCTLLDKGIDVTYLALMALLLARPIDRWLTNWALLEGNWSLRLVVLLLTLIGFHVCVSFPLSYYSGYALEHRFGLSRLTFFGWLWRYAKRLALMVAFTLAILLGLFWLIWTVGPYWWVFAAGAFFLVSVVLGQLVPVLILPLFYKIQRLDDPQLAGRMAGLVKGTGLSIEGVYRVALSEETVKANAMLAGLGRTRRVLLGDTLLDRFTAEEIEVIFAHEVGHHVYRHIWKMILAGIVYSAAGFWICDRLLAAWVGRPAGTFDYATTPVYALPLVVLILTVFANLLEPVQNLISRRYERQCDRYALGRTGLKEAYVSAFRKLARLNKDDPAPAWLEVVLFHSHPPIAQRLALAEEQ